jgi:hypothetical protein
MHWLLGASERWADRCLACGEEFDGERCPRCSLARRDVKPEPDPASTGVLAVSGYALEAAIAANAQALANQLAKQP